MSAGVEDAAWRLVVEGYDPAREPHRQTLFALADGLVGVRGGLEEAPSATDGAFAAGGFETSEIHYHERHAGFARATDTRLPVADGTRIGVLLDGQPVGFDTAECLSLTRELDLLTGRLTRTTRWRLGDAEIEVRAQRVMAGDAAQTLAIRFEVTSVSFTGRLTLTSSIDAHHHAEPQGDDPRVGAAVPGGGWISETSAPGVVVQHSRRSGRWTACAQAHRAGAGLGLLPGEGPAPLARFTAGLTPGRTVRLEKTVAYAQSDAAPDLETLTDRAEAAAEAGFDALAASRAAELAAFWNDADVRLSGDPAAQLALRLNIFHSRQSASADERFGTAAKGLTGEGYEGHVFWDSEAFLGPLLTFTAPDLARAMLMQRYSQLDAARANARALNHAQGALFAWRTIAGGECSAHYPTGSAQYHVNAAVAQAIQLYVTATGDREFLREAGAEMLVETARLWMALGSFSPRHGGAFCIFGVTGPDEYTALVDNNFYTNRMAALCLAYAADVAQAFPAAGVMPQEIVRWREAAAAMRLPHDPRLNIDAQDDSFLDKPRWPLADRTETTDGRHAPLLLGVHPMTLFRHQVSKQADLVLAMVFAGHDVDPELKRRNFDYYEGVTTHDSTLSNCPFAILAARVGELEKAGGYFRRNLLVDLDDRHGNTSHGMHMAALAGSWMAAVYGFAGFEWRSETPAFAPVLPPGWEGLSFRLRWQGRRIEVEIGQTATRYRLLDGPALDIRHDGTAVTIPAGGAWIEREAAPRRSAA